MYLIRTTAVKRVVSATDDSGDEYVTVKRSKPRGKVSIIRGPLTMGLGLLDRFRFFRRLHLDELHEGRKPPARGEIVVQVECECRQPVASF